jgi:hypothetical protein
MRTTLASTIIALALALGACGADDGGLSRTQVEDRVSKEIGEQQDKPATTACVEGSEERTFRCKVTVDSATSTIEARVTSTYEARVSKTAIASRSTNTDGGDPAR